LKFLLESVSNFWIGFDDIEVSEIKLFKSSLIPKDAGYKKLFDCYYKNKLNFGLQIVNRRLKVGADENKNKALEMAFMQIEKQFGKGSIMKLGQAEAQKGIQVISTGSISLDSALGVGGIPRGRITEIFGPESSGKTSLTLHVIAEAQKAGGVAAFIDAEHALDPHYAQNLGVNLDDLLLSQPDTGEQTLEIAEVLVRSGAVDVVVVDSVAALVPKAELDGDMGDSHMGLQARLMSQAMRKLTGVVSKSRCSLVFINQIRMKIGVMFGNPETTTGGNALKFYCSVRLDIRRIAALKDGDSVIGNRTRVKVVKNKVAPPFRDCEFDILYGKGISKEGDILDLGVAHDLIKKSGTWYSYKETRIGQGRENAKNFLRENKDILTEVEIAIRQKLAIPSHDGTMEPTVSGVEPSEPSEASEKKKKSKKEN
jgi:recombination protein RecA